MRRPVLRMVLAVLMLLLAACGGAPAIPATTTLVTQVPTATAPAATAAPAAPLSPTTMSSTTPEETALPETPATSALRDVPRNRTLLLGWGMGSPIGVTNPWAVPGYTHQEGNNLLWEGLSYYAIFADNEFDSSTLMPAALIGNILRQNPKITSYTGKQPPYGYLDWWPVSLWMNTQLAPYSDVRVRRAMSLALDRDTLDELLYEGAKVTTIYPFPLYPGLQRVCW